MKRVQRLVQSSLASVSYTHLVVLDYAGFVDGKQFEGGTAKEQVLTLGSGMFIPGFETQLVGAEKGSDVLVTVTFPEDYRATELAGKPAEFKCHVLEIREKTPYELDDVFAKEVGGCETLAEMKEKLRQSLQAYYDDRAEMEAQDSLKMCIRDRTYFLVSGELERSKVPINLLITDASGMSVLTAWAAGKFSSTSVKKFFDEFDLANKINNRTLIIPGKVAVMKGEIQDKLPEWNVVVGTREAVELVKYLKEDVYKRQR